MRRWPCTPGSSLSLVRACVVILGAVGSVADEVRFEHTAQCASPFAAAPVAQHTLYGEAFEWTHQATLTDWSYESIEATDSGLKDWTGAPLHHGECARVSYTSTVRMPGVLRKYTSLGSFKPRVVKTTCVQREVITTSFSLRKLPFIDSVDIHSIMTFARGEVHTSTTTAYTLPWFAHFLSSLGSGIVQRSIEREIHATVHQLCSGGSLM